MKKSLKIPLISLAVSVLCLAFSFINYYNRKAEYIELPVQQESQESREFTEYRKLLEIKEAQTPKLLKNNKDLKNKISEFEQGAGNIEYLSTVYGERYVLTKTTEGRMVFLAKTNDPNLNSKDPNLRQYVNLLEEKVEHLGKKELGETVETLIKNNIGVSRVSRARLGKLVFSKISEIYDKDFDSKVLNSDKPVGVDFWESWCGPCQATAPVIECVSEKYAGKMNFYKMSADGNKRDDVYNPEGGIPCFVIFKNGKPVDSIHGAGFGNEDYIRFNHAIKKALE